MVQTQFSTPIRVFRSNSSGEYFSDIFHQFLASEGTLAQLSCPSAHAQNSVVERKHHHLIETTRTFLISLFVPSYFWGEAVSTAVYLINRQPSSKLFGKSPGEVIIPPNYDHLRVFMYMLCFASSIIPDFENKTRYTPYMSLRIQISYIATNEV